MSKTLERARSHANNLKLKDPSRARQEEINKLDYEDCKEDKQAINEYYTRPDQLKDEYLDHLKTLSNQK